LKQLPAPDRQMRAAGLPGRVFPAVGNHEVWDDSDVEGLLSAFPYLKRFGVSDKRLIYKFVFNGISTGPALSSYGPVNKTIARHHRGTLPSPRTKLR
jgi:hypothetical protein